MTVSQSLVPQRKDAREGMGVELLFGAAAAAWLKDDAHIAAWARLYERCAWSVAFLGPDFYRVWLRHYGQSWQPLLLTMTDAQGLRAVMPLCVRDGLVTGAGAHQADYHAWVSDLMDDTLFLKHAFAKIAGRFPRHAVRLRYLPPRVPEVAIDQLRKLPRATIRPSHRHTIKLDRGEIEASLKKKGNKSKINRLKRAGALTYRELDADAFAVCFDDVIEWYDFRQGALIDSTPFRNDPLKKVFHLDWLRALPKQLIANGMFLDNRLISILVYVMSKDEAHNAIVAHAPEHGDNSPNKFHMYEVGLGLAAKNLARLDLTPGGEEWKSRFSDAPERVFELTVHGSAMSAAITRTSQYLDQLAHKVAADLKVPVSDIKAIGRRSAALPGDLWGRMTRTPQEAPLRYAIAAGARAGVAESQDVRVNPLSLLLDHGPTLAGLERQPFLARTWFRMEAGERCYVLPNAEGIAALGWLSVPNGKTVLSDFLALDDASCRILLTHMVATRTDTVEIVVPRGSGVLRDAVAALGGVPVS